MVTEKSTFKIVLVVDLVRNVFFNKSHLLLSKLYKYFYNNTVVLTLQRAISFPLIPSILKYYPLYLGLIMYQVLKLYSYCIIVAKPKTWNIYGPQLCVWSVNLPKSSSTNSHANVTYEILLSCLHASQNYGVVVYAEPELLIPILSCFWSINWIQTTWQSWWHHLGNSFIASTISILILT